MYHIILCGDLYSDYSELKNLRGLISLANIRCLTFSFTDTTFSQRKVLGTSGWVCRLIVLESGKQRAASVS